jgi:acyl carrier protein
MDELKIFIQSEIKNIAFKKVEFDESLIKSKLLDSISVIDLIVSIEENISKQIPQYLINNENFETINNIIETIKKI